MRLCGCNLTEWENSRPSKFLNLLSNFLTNIKSSKIKALEATNKMQFSLLLREPFWKKTALHSFEEQNIEPYVEIVDHKASRS